MPGPNPSEPAQIPGGTPNSTQFDSPVSRTGVYPRVGEPGR